jgi:hypothetical protein
MEAHHRKTARLEWNTGMFRRSVTGGYYPRLSMLDAYC